MANKYNIHFMYIKTDINFKFQQIILFIVENKFYKQIFTEIRVPLQIILICMFSGSIFIKISCHIGISAGNSNQTRFRFQSGVISCDNRPQRVNLQSFPSFTKQSTALLPGTHLHLAIQGFVALVAHLVGKQQNQVKNCLG